LVERDVEGRGLGREEGKVEEEVETGDWKGESGKWRIESRD
jgi:hypothetical protein